ncbi:MAG: flagellar biosynthesis protein FliQ [Spirochaetota bacterium]|mgnify:FL=1|jgi:flagellar biosynthetic protein FliQ|uniref:Flagellar biosynthetic protein FliQ n=1 Tax=Gracilinema caldarium TaxID=215591 RepID=A0A7C3EA49_9SPIR|nr:flagellar biosynthesis protein FliQ [Gracilinema caldarium]NLJ08736.1 flagellar biosynthesis protein FliQ [Treponema sp.]HON12630.1 flagellar biosynthesis protein FliQ [Treponema sp.]
MGIGDIVTLMRGGIFQVIILSAPILITALVVGLIISILQATTSIQEQTLTFVPKIIAILLVLALLGGFMFSSLGDYTIQLFKMIPAMAR